MSSGPESSVGPELRALVAGILPPPESALADVLAALSSAGRYQVGPVVGSGGHGTVVRAFDATLQRMVALKLLRAPGPDAAARFLREARLQASVEHEHVCRVYDVGEIAGTAYIAMEHVEGMTLGAAAREMRLEELVRVVQQVAEGAHAAHRLGLIHRDLKPSNVMVQRTDGGWRPSLVDFGLSRDTAAPAQSATGAIVGTYQYMAPEQARGDLRQIDRRTDVYGLGATLYHLLAGRPPFDGEGGAQILVRVLQEEPPPLRALAPQVPRDLEAIVLRCLEKQPSARYDSARALAEDLGRFLDGAPVQARRSPAYRAAKWARRHRAALAAGLAVLLTAVAGAGAALRARAGVRAAAELVRQAGEIEIAMRLGYLQPLHDIGREKAAVRRRLGELETSAQAAGAARGPAHYALGRAYLALHDHARARAELDAAWAEGYRTPEVASALGAALSALYEQALAEAARLGSKPSREAARQQAEREYRDAALAALRQARGAIAEGPELVEALLAQVEGREDDALERARQAFAASPSSYEAKALEGRVHLARGRRLQESGEYPAALEAYARAGEALAAATDIARSDPALYLEECRRQEAMLNIQIRSGTAKPEAFEPAMAPCARAIQAEPSQVTGYALASRLCVRWAADYLEVVGADPEPALARAAALADQAVARAPADPVGLREKGWACLLDAERRYSTGRDAAAAFACATDYLQRATRADPTFAPTFDALGRAHLSMSEWQVANLGRDPREELAAAAAAHQAAIELNPKLTGARNNLGLAFKERALFEQSIGADPRDSYAKAEASYRASIATDPRNAFAYSNLATLQCNAARLELQAGRDPEPAAAAGIATAATAVQLNPMAVGAYNAASDCWLVRAVKQARAGGDPSAAFDAARAQSHEAVTRNAHADVLWLQAAQIELAAARWALRAGRPSAMQMVHAEEYLQKGLSDDPKMGELHAESARLALLQARAAPTPAAAAQAIARGRQELERARAGTRISSDAVALGGALELESARRAGPGPRQVEAARAAAAAFAEAIRRTPLLAADWSEEVADAERLAQGGVPHTLR